MNEIKENELLKIGWREWVALPDLGIPAIKAKIDTGARTSALHAFDLKIIEKEGREKVHFRIRPLQRKKKLVLVCTSDLVEQRMVTDSGGHREMRPVIRTPVSMGNIRWFIEITLTRRDTMKFRMLLGRSALNARFLIDPAESYLTGKALSKYYSNSKASFKASGKASGKPSGRSL
jgi:hypothetical protein